MLFCHNISSKLTVAAAAAAAAVAVAVAVAVVVVVTTSFEVLQDNIVNVLEV